jgi:hypothetical protein
VHLRRTQERLAATGQIKNSPRCVSDVPGIVLNNEASDCLYDAPGTIARATFNLRLCEQATKPL